MTTRTPLAIVGRSGDDSAPAPPLDLAPLLTADEVAHILGVGFKRVYELPIPRIHLSARSLRWRRADVAAWLESRRTAG